jgi:hypothetical protein
MTTVRRWCLVINHEKNPVGNIFSLELTPEVFVDQLKKMVKSKMTHRLDGINANKLTVWRCTTLPIGGHGGEGGRHIDFSTHEDHFVIGERVGERAIIANLGLAVSDVLLLQLPGTSLFVESRSLLKNASYHTHRYACCSR